jgi:glycosyltransferase involved in cell wall biosynthesis
VARSGWPFTFSVLIFVLSSDWESYPLSVVEAMASGLPIVSTAAGGVPELIENGKDSWCRLAISEVFPIRCFPSSKVRKRDGCSVLQSLAERKTLMCP